MRYLILALLATAAHAADLTFTFPDAARGTIYLSLYNQANIWDQSGNPVQESKIAAGSSAQITFRNLPAGTYAAKAFLDLNSNGQLDKNFMGIPKEPYGFSKDAPGRFGPPTFSDAAFELPESGLKTAIHLPE